MKNNKVLQLMLEYKEDVVEIYKDSIAISGLQKAIEEAFSDMTMGELRPTRVLEDTLEDKIYLVFDNKFVKDYKMQEFSSWWELTPVDEDEDEE